MKKDRMDVMLLSLISSIMLAGCSTTASSTDKVKVTEPVVSNVETIADNTISKDAIKRFVKKNKEEYEDVIYELKDNEIHIEEKEFKDQTIYFFLYTPDDYWSTMLFQIREENGIIQGLDYISEGSTDYFNFDVISISEGDFVTVYSASHMGNGTLELINMDELPDREIGSVPDYEMYAIDGHYEDMVVDNVPVTSKVFENGILTPEYKDVNEDGNTDVVLSGVVQEYEFDEEADTHNLKSAREVCQIYEFDPAAKTFTLQSGEDLREKKQLSISDTVVNNHELLNDTPCTEYKVQDIYQYQGEPLKTIDYQNEEGAYCHYLVYDGIIYVVISDDAVTESKELDQNEYIDYVILTNELYSLSIGIQVGMDAGELADTGIDFEVYTNGDDLDSELLSGKTGYLRKMKIDYDSIYYAESSFDENTALAVIVNEGKVVRITTDNLY